MDRRYQVFVSSTYTDLIDERREVIQALLELDCIPAGMEMFPAANEDQWSLIKDVIDASDYYVVIVGGRYGSMTEEGLSYTEMEYDYATEKGVPVLGFVHGDPSAIALGKSEPAADVRVKLDAFREKVKQKMVKQYSTPAELGSVVSRGLTRTIKKNPRAGWVRGDEAMTDEVRAEIAELRAALAESEKARVTNAVQASELALDLSFEHGEDEVSLDFIATSGLSWNPETQESDMAYTWDEIIDLLGPFMLNEAPEPDLRTILQTRIRGDLIALGKGWERLENLSVAVRDDSWGRILVQLRALGVIASGSKKRAVNDKNVYWMLTPAGDEYLVRLKATKRQPTPTA